MRSTNRKQKEIAERLGTHAHDNWHDWRWQVRHTVRSIEAFEKLLAVRFPEDEKAAIRRTLEKFPLSITPHYLSLIDTEDLRNDPVFKQAFPHSAELIVQAEEMGDPLAEDRDSPAPGITHRYPDRVLFHVSNVCSMYCRHCTRKRKVGDVESIPDQDEIERGLAYIEQTPVVRDVLLSGGDPLMLPDDRLEAILARLHAMPHVEIVRIGTRMPVVLPYRITDDLVRMLSRYHPVWINTHFNHPRELSPSSEAALKKLADAGFPLGNQSVLLAGVNDCPRIQKRLAHRLLQNRVRPYYLYQCDMSEGLAHFRTPVSKGLEIMESLRGHTSGMGVPTYVIDAPGGGGKIPVMPNYLISWATNKVVLRNYEGVITTYKEPDSYEPVFCDRRCDDCRLQLKLEGATEHMAIGLEKLLVDWDQTQSLTPTGNERLARRRQRRGKAQQR